MITYRSEASQSHGDGCSQPERQLGDEQFPVGGGGIEHASIVLRSFSPAKLSAAIVEATISGMNQEKGAIIYTRRIRSFAG